MNQEQFQQQNQVKYPPLAPQPAQTVGEPVYYMANNPQYQQYQQQPVVQPQMNQQQMINNPQYQAYPQQYQPQMYQQQPFSNQPQMQQQQQLSQPQAAQLTAKQICANTSDPVSVVCPNCNKYVLTDIKKVRPPGLISLAFNTVTLGLVSATKDKFHYCPNCNAEIGVCQVIKGKKIKRK
ncbi:LITAF-like zinc ribbon domain protein (macronuclear) [Tetrahymena thermophila SB210]|uniref:LITAF-like zinc ribbon domain protein n=1 Tax=Tetrahymena thermophila (strain SB210) TaxID=312017 RepID=Q22SR7_TETTS|nr:LITAF-like zinc ribbon domain protein [Tetrahymena thermophila SB210]EAR88308.3 LITAF-like zinc ribbon domain protein [Tetrahymena thermophila SB210]|eukprot:XP_001008553.3 LITAF-like zinc ribbon domain protein [Tetrahymena thermophila SB210]